MWRVLLWLYPPEFRDDHAAEIESFVADERARLGREGRSLGLAFRTRIGWDLARGALRLRLNREPRRVHDHRALSAGAGGARHAASEWLRDLHHAARGLRHAPVLTVTVVLTLGLGIGFNTALFSVVHGVLLRPLAYPEAEALVYVQASYATDGVADAPHSGGDFRAIQEGVPALDDVAAVGTIRQNLTGLEPPRRISVGWASHNLFEVLGVSAALGRGFEPHDPPGTMVLSHGLWTSAFGQDPAVIGRTISLDGHPYVVVGVMPTGFRVHLPEQNQNVQAWKLPDTWWQNGDPWAAQGASFGLFRVVGRMESGATLAEAGSQLAVVSADLRAAHPEYANSGLELTPTPLLANVVRDARPTLMLLLGAVALVLLIACANVTNLLLARTQQRSHEIALRTALGSSRGRTARLFLAESAILAALGGAAGVGLALLGIRALPFLAPRGLPRLDEVALAPGVLLFAGGISLVCTILVGSFPALRVARAAPGRGLYGRSGAVTKGVARLGAGLVVTQIALSLVLVTGASLLVSSLVRLHQVEPGFDSENLLTFSVSVPGTQYGWPLEADQFFRRLEDRVEALPGVQSAGVVWPMPMAGGLWSEVYVAGDVDERARAYADYRLATPTYFETVGGRLVSGRIFAPEDSRHVAVVSRRLAESAWPGRSAVGQTIQAKPWGGELQDFEIVGVVDDIRYMDLREAAEPAVYFDSRSWAWTDWEVNFMVRTSVEPSALIDPIRAELFALDPMIPLDSPIPMSDLVAGQLARNRFAMSLLGTFALVAAVLAMVGLYGVLSYAVGQRTREIGVRMALGSETRTITALIVGRGMRIVVVGVGMGIVGALLLTHLLSGFLFGTSPTDPVTLASVVVGFTGVAALAAYLPARRATSLDPATVLRAD